MSTSTSRYGRWRVTKTLLLPILFLLLLTILNGGAFVSADDLDDGEEESFPDPVAIEDSPPTPSSEDPSPIIPVLDPVPTVDVPSTLPPSPIPIPPLFSTPAPSPTPLALPPLPPPQSLPTTPSGVLKQGTPSAECAVIADLYKATGPWRFVPDTVNCCNAEYLNSSGVKCNANGQIIYIYLAGQGLSGTLPESLGSLTALQYLLLYYNNLSGPIPSGLSNLPLVILDLSHNRLSGSLPSSAAGWVNMGILNLEQNALTGSLPDWLTTLPNLHSLAIGQNLFTTGDVPNAFTFNLEPVTNGSTPLSTIPPSVNPGNFTPPQSTFLDLFTRLPKLKQLKLDSLGVSGGFPASWQLRMTNLTKLDLSNNSMQGQIPGFINGYSGLKTLLLDRNEFGGPIPVLDSLRSLSVLDLSYNQLSGPLPPWAAGLNLTIMNMSNNLLSGPLPMDKNHAWRACSVASNYFVCTKGPEQVLSAKWKSDCRAQCSDVQPIVPTVRPAVSLTLPEIRVHQTHNGGTRSSPWSLLLGWAALTAILFPLP
ncbi:hypothetical protein BGZ98_005730 [Dissophora globulifera]|nr:hypothetical protein BGZ98_005730 [Dissophora globulifera]